MADEKKEALALEEKAIRASYRPPPEDVAVKAQQLRDNAVALYRLQVWRTRFG